MKQILITIIAVLPASVAGEVMCDRSMAESVIHGLCLGWCVVVTGITWK